MKQIKELLDNDPFDIDGMSFTEFKAHCKTLGIKGVTPEKVLALFTPSDHEGIYNHENTNGILIELSDPNRFECNRIKKAKQYYFCVM